MELGIVARVVHVQDFRTLAVVTAVLSAVRLGFSFESSASSSRVPSDPMVTILNTERLLASRAANTGTGLVGVVRPAGHLFRSWTWTKFSVSRTSTQPACGICFSGRNAQRCRPGSPRRVRRCLSVWWYPLDIPTTAPNGPVSGIRHRCALHRLIQAIYRSDRRRTSPNPQHGLAANRPRAPRAADRSPSARTPSPD